MKAAISSRAKEIFQTDIDWSGAKWEVGGIVFDGFLAFIASFSLPPPDAIKLGYRNCHM